MHRRHFLAAGGAWFLAGCAARGKEWSDVPWVAQAAPPAAPAPRVVAYTGPSAIHPAPPMPAPTTPSPGVAKPCSPCAVPPPMPDLRLPARRGPTWTLVTRAEWGAECLRANHDPMVSISRITLHHTDEHAGMRGKSDVDVVRGIQRYHQDQQGWADIGYHYLVGVDGRIYEGRASSVQGAHSGGANNVGNLGISIIGNFNDKLPSRRQLDALEAFLEDRREALGLRANALYGHRDLSATECPGVALYEWLQDLKRRT
jgi:hypothetical protein